MVSDLDLFFVELEDLRVILTSSSCRLVLLAFLGFFHCPILFLISFFHCSCSARAACDPWRHLLSTPVLNNLSFLSLVMSLRYDTAFSIFLFFYTGVVIFSSPSPWSASMTTARSVGRGWPVLLILEESWLSAAHIVMFLHTGTHNFQVLNILCRR